MVEIDKMVVDVCKEFLPQTACKLNDPRVHLYFEDGLRYIRSKENEYDLIIVDSTDPFGPGEGLFTKEFYGNCFKALTEDGILVNQHENAYYTSFAQSMRRAHCRIVNLFPICKVYQAHIDVYKRQLQLKLKYRFIGSYILRMLQKIHSEKLRCNFLCYNNLIPVTK